MSISSEQFNKHVTAENSMYSVNIPIAQVECSSDGRFYINLRGLRRPVVWIEDVSCWFTLDATPVGMQPSAPVWITETGEWVEGSLQTFATRPSRNISCEQQCVFLPPAPFTDKHPRNIIPLIHYIWIGGAPISDALYEIMQNNVRKCPSWRFILHVHPDSKKSWNRLQKQFPAGSRIIIRDLRNSAEFSEFLASEPGKYYQRFLERKSLNYGAAADILRLFLLHRNGGLYIDVDDEIEMTVPCGFRLKAGPHELLLTGQISVTVYDFHGFGNSAFACHAGNIVLADMLEEICQRIREAEDFFRLPRPWYTTSSQFPRAEMLSYIKQIFNLTGPLMFTDVLKKHCPALFTVEPDLLRAYQILNVTPSEPRIISDEYLQAFESAAHALIPLAGPIFKVKVGHAHSWNPPACN